MENSITYQQEIINNLVNMNNNLITENEKLKSELERKKTSKDVDIEILKKNLEQLTVKYTTLIEELEEEKKSYRKCIEEMLLLRTEYSLIVQTLKENLNNK